MKLLEISRFKKKIMIRGEINSNKVINLSVYDIFHGDDLISVAKLWEARSHPKAAQRVIFAEGDIDYNDIDVQLRKYHEVSELSGIDISFFEHNSKTKIAVMRISKIYSVIEVEGEFLTERQLLEPTVCSFIVNGSEIGKANFFEPLVKGSSRRLHTDENVDIINQVKKALFNGQQCEIWKG
ncbi:MAG: hypothetical protein QM796_13160 [Chthoniobacteraceae bacterium]